MMKKLGAIALTATMMLSLIGCSKKNFDGNYTADVDLSQYMGTVMKDAMESAVGTSDYEWTGTLVVPYKLELSEGEYTLTVDAEATSDNFKAYMEENIEPFMTSVFENEIASEPSLEGMTIDEVLEAAGYSSIWETMGYESKEDFIADYMTEFEVSDFEEEETGEYEIDGDSITLKGVETVGEDGEEGEGWVLTYEDGNLTGVLDLSEFDIDEDTDITFVLDAE
ncbi:hypothetical protein [Butyrivibrio fibrisolvens]|jgi:hypothetical protein|uniref:Lipoprotein n=1 Tax=Butyrivibrio fibrisolvens TaxID=831 RepID=A0A317G6G7_BUTFI|nr:hypothetical protein [Butyrivibrio fibrisolvens]MBQ1458723.1 hypothetical protein [Butyrivibrio sp.]PWT29009.1 hypothetical protein CPT75_18735 [Butyrivibrio fibrisolvens]